MIFARTNAAGADMKLAASRSPAESGPSNPMYTASTEPAIVANPPVIRAISSERVIDRM